MVRRAILIVMSSLVLFASLGVSLVLLSMQDGHAMQLRVGAVALTPETAVRTMLNNRGAIAGFQVVGQQRTSAGMLVVYHYTLQQGGRAPQVEFGYALTTLRRGGWSVTSANIEQPMRSEPVSYATTRIGQDLLIYGYATTEQIRAVAVSLDTGVVITQGVTQHGFSVFAVHAQALRQLQTIGPAPHLGRRYTLLSVVDPDDD